MPSKRPLQANIPNPGTVYIVSHLPLPPVKPARRIIFQRFFPPPPPPLSLPIVLNTCRRMYVCAHICIHALTRTRIRASIRVRMCGRVRAPTRLGERYGVPRGAIRRITTRDTPYLFLTLPLGPVSMCRKSVPMGKENLEFRKAIGESTLSRVTG